MFSSLRHTSNCTSDILVKTDKRSIIVFILSSSFIFPLSTIFKFLKSLSVAVIESNRWVVVIA